MRASVALFLFIPAGLRNFGYLRCAPSVDEVMRASTDGDGKIDLDNFCEWLSEPEKAKKEESKVSPR